VLGWVPTWKRPVRLSGTEKRRKTIQKSHAEVGFLGGVGIRRELCKIAGSAEFLASAKSIPYQAFQWFRLRKTHVRNPPPLQGLLRSDGAT
jgi:hypothetical protein